MARSRRISPLHAMAMLSTARIRFGIGPFNYCLFSIDGRSPRDWREYLTNTDVEPVQRRWNPKNQHFLVRDKLSFYRRCSDAGLPVPTLIGVIAPPGTELPQVNVLTDPESLHAALQSAEAGEFFLKHSGGAHGHGAFSVRRRGEDYEFAGRIDGAAALFRHACASLPSDEVYLVQPRLKNQGRLAQIMSPNGLGTIRAVTLLRDDSCTLLTACLRITVGSNVTDNFSVGRAGNLTSAIDIADGKLGQAVGSRSKAWPDMHTVHAHPDTGVPFADFALPDWHEIRALVLRAHRAFPELGVIGWDIAVTDHGPVLIEANHAWDINLLQVAHMRGFRTEMRDALGAF